MDKTEFMRSIDEELSSLLTETLRQGITQDDLRKFLLPITSMIQPTYRKRSHQDTLRWCWKVLPVLVFCFLALSFWTEAVVSLRSTIRFHGLALLRIALVRMLPIWNWTELYYSRCLIRNPFFEDQELKLDDCNLCETLEDINRIVNVSQTTVIEEYIKRERPFIVTDAMEDWPIMTTDHFWFDNITELYLHQDKYRVCNLNTNLRMGDTGDLAWVLRKLYSPHTDQWFLHWENCQKDGAKATRQFYRRPYFISNSLDFTGSNWVLMSSDFKGRVYKSLGVRDSLSMLYQIRGSNHIRLSPRETCRTHCPELTFTLYEGEILILTNLLWTLEYIPGDNGDNLGILSEVSWPSLD